MSNGVIDPTEIGPLRTVLGTSPDLAASFAGTKVHSALWHGDFAPWNIRISGDGRWRVIDWERGELNGPPAWDWFHYIIQRAVLVHRESGPQLAATADALLASSEFKSYAEGAGITVTARALITAYLMHCLHIVRQVDGRSALEGLLAHYRSRP
jgi:aminoglycoside phosphotransferase (APT) family kinase protein